ncbi:TPA: hypothetical protein OCX34_004586 [Escherichia coli]|nr:hypothetical protein [Escherichia coli]HDT1280194.1 hypothetical protein [Klebsiella quasipneumoniae subsp. similipneumoniae]
MMTKHDKERFNKRIGGEVQISADIPVSDFMTEGAAYVTITESTESSLYERVCQYALQHGEDLQGMFKDEKYEYMSCFVCDVAAFRANFENEETLKPLFNHGKGDTVEFVISVPEKRVED